MSVICKIQYWIEKAHGMTRGPSVRSRFSMIVWGNCADELLVLLMHAYASD
jgi:hypothetical protein